MKKLCQVLLILLFVCLVPLVVNAQSFRVQCPTSTITHPVAANNNSEPAYTGPTYTGTNGYGTTPAHVNGAIKCQQISGGDGYATMGDGTQTYMFSFGPLSGLTKIANGQPGTDFPVEFNTSYTGPTLQPGDPATTRWRRPRSKPSFDVSLQRRRRAGPRSRCDRQRYLHGAMPGWPRRSPPNAGCGSDERQHSGADDCNR